MVALTVSRQALGRWGEDLAASYLAAQGYQVLERNVRTPHGEIDLVARDPGMLVFVEVKTRRSASFGPPEESVTPRKRLHLSASAQAYLQSHPELDGNWRLDVIAIRLFKSEPPEIVHFENIDLEEQ